MITAPFNFVPLNEKVFFPPWAEQANHDLPFEDAQSGVIEIKITAKSPIFIRNHSSDREKPSEDFCQYNKEYYIPSTSVKGMIRNVLEIMSFSKMSKESYDDDTFAVRDLSNAKNFYMKQMNLIDEPFTECGWLKIVDGEYIIEDCGTPGRIHHGQIDHALGTNFAENFQSDNFDAKDQEQKSSQYKYNLVEGKIHTITVGDKYSSEKNKKYDKREFYKYDKNGKNETQLILTGQPTPRQNTGEKGDGKGFEFLFFQPKDELIVNKKVVENFKFAYFDERKTEPKESPDWTYWKEKLYAGEKVPVFFQKSGNKVLHFGLSYLYKLPYKFSVKDGIFKSHSDDRLDLAQTLFGYVSQDSKKALKGRVQFSHFKAKNNPQVLKARTEVLGTPRASYYPIYVRQHSTDFLTFMDSNFEIAGRKRYPIHKGNTTRKTDDTQNNNVGTTFKPLNHGVVFEGKLRYHNLKRVELGALLSALTFHNTPNTFHNIGMAKSLGYGKIEVKPSGVSNIEAYLKEFEMHMMEQIPEWKESLQLQELLTMAVEQNNEGNSKLEYMKLENFANNKSKTKDYLKCYSELDNIVHPKFNSLVNEEDLKELQERHIQHKKQQEIYENERKEKQEYTLKLNEAKKSRNIDKLNAFLKRYPESEDRDELEGIINDLVQEDERSKRNAIEAAAKEQWEKIHKADVSKFLEESLKRFIEEYSHSIYVVDAKNELANMVNKETKKVEKIHSLDFLESEESLKDASKKIKQYLSGRPINEDEKSQVANFVNAHKELLPSNAKKRKKELKEYAKWIDIAEFLN